MLFRSLFTLLGLIITLSDLWGQSSPLREALPLGKQNSLSVTGSISRSASTSYRWQCPETSHYRFEFQNHQPEHSLGAWDTFPTNTLAKVPTVQPSQGNHILFAHKDQFYFFAVKSSEIALSPFELKMRQETTYPDHDHYEGPLDLTCRLGTFDSPEWSEEGTLTEHFGPENSLWFHWEAPSTGTYSFTPGPERDATLQLFDPKSLEPLPTIGTDNSVSVIEFEAGQKALIGNSGSEFSIVHLFRPKHDRIANARRLFSIPDNFTVRAELLFAESSDNSQNLGISEKVVWYEIAMSETESFHLSSSGVGVGLITAFFEKPNGHLGRIGGGREELWLTFRAGTRYFIAVGLDEKSVSSSGTTLRHQDLTFKKINVTPSDDPSQAIAVDNVGEPYLESGYHSSLDEVDHLIDEGRHTATKSIWKKWVADFSGHAVINHYNQLAVFDASPTQDNRIDQAYLDSPSARTFPCTQGHTYWIWSGAEDGIIYGWFLTPLIPFDNASAKIPRSISGESGNETFLMGPRNFLKDTLDDRRITTSGLNGHIAFLDWVCPADGAYHFQIERVKTSPSSFDGIIYQENPDQSLSRVSFGRLYDSSYSIRARAGRRYLIQITSTSDHRLLCFGKLRWEKINALANDLVTRPEEIVSGQSVRANPLQASIQADDPLLTNPEHLSHWQWHQVPLRTLHYRWTPSSVGAYEFQLAGGNRYLTIYPEDQDELLSPPFNSNRDFYVSEIKTYRVIVSLNSPSSEGPVEFSIQPVSRPLGEFFETPFLDDGSGSIDRPVFASHQRVYDTYRGQEKNIYNSPSQKAWSKWTAQASGWYTTSDQRPAFRGSAIEDLEILETAFYVEAGESIYYCTGSRPEEHAITIEPGPETSENLTRQHAAILSGDYPQIHQFNDASPDLPTLRWYSFTVASPTIISIETLGHILSIYLEDSPLPLFDFTSRPSWENQQVSLDAGTYFFPVLWSRYIKTGSVSVSEITEPGDGDTINAPIDLGSSLTARHPSGLFSDDLSDPPIISGDHLSFTRDYASAWATWTAPKDGVFHFANCEIHPYSEPLTSPLPSWGPAVTLEAGEKVLLRAFYNNDSKVRQLQFGPISDLSSQDHGSLVNAIPLTHPLLGSDFEIPLSMYGTSVDQQTLGLTGFSSITNPGWYRWQPTSPGDYDISIREGSLVKLYKRQGNGEIQPEDLTLASNPVSLEPEEELFILARKNSPTHPTGDLLTYLTIKIEPINPRVAPNDDFADATEIISGERFFLRTGDATTELSEPHSSEETVWWKFQPDEDLTAKVEYTLSNSGNTVEYFEGDSLESLSDIPNLTRVTDTRFTFPALAGKTYYLQVNLSPDWFRDRSSLLLETGISNGHPSLSLPVSFETEITFDPNESITRNHWYHFAPSESGPVHLSFQQPSSATFDVYELIPPSAPGTAVTTSAPRWGSDLFLVEATKSYLIKVQSEFRNNLPLETFSISKAGAASNDRRANAHLLPSTSSVQARIPLANSTITPDEVSSSRANATWAKYTAPEDGLYQISFPASSQEEPSYRPSQVTVFTTSDGGVSRQTTYDVPPAFTLSLKAGELAEFLFSSSSHAPENADSFRFEIERIHHEGNDREQPLMLGNTGHGFLRTSIADANLSPLELIEHRLEDDSWGSVWWEWPWTEESLFSSWAFVQGKITVHHDGPQASEQRLTVYRRIDAQTLTPISFAQNSGIHSDLLSASFSGGSVLIRYSAPRQYNNPVEIEFERLTDLGLHGEFSRIIAQDDETKRLTLLDSKEFSIGASSWAPHTALLCWDRLRKETNFGDFLANFYQLPKISETLPLANFQLTTAPSESIASLTPEEFGQHINTNYRQDLEFISSALTHHLDPTFEDSFATSELGIAFQIDAVDLAGIYFLTQGLLTIADIFESANTDLTIGEIFEHSFDSAAFLQWLVADHPDITWKSGSADKRGLAFANFANTYEQFQAIASAYQSGAISSQREQHPITTSPDQFQKLTAYVKFLSNQDQADFFALLGMEAPLSDFSADLNAEGKIRAFSLSDPSLDGIFPLSTQATWNKILRNAGILSNPGTYAEWEDRQINLNPGFLPGKEIDSDQNGQTNWEDYALGNSPLLLNADLTFSLSKLIEPIDVTYRLQKLSPTGWETVNDMQFGEALPVGDRQMQFLIPPKMQPKVIYRLHATDRERE